MMHGHEKSDDAIVAVKRRERPRRRAAEERYERAPLHVDHVDHGSSSLPRSWPRAINKPVQPVCTCSARRRTAESSWGNPELFLKSS